MDGPEQQGSASLNKTTTNSAPNVSGNSKNETSLFPLPSYWTQSVLHPSADSLSLFRKGLTEQKETFVEASHHNLAPPKPNHPNDAFTESGSTVELDRFSKRLVDTEEEDEAPDKGGIDKQDGQKQMVSVGNLEEKRALDISNAKSRNNTSEAPSMRLFKFQLRECSNELQNPSSANNQSREPAANVSSILPRSEHRSSFTYRNDKLVSFAGGETENSKTECASFVPPGISLSTVRTRAISTGKPPLPPGAVTHLKGGVTPKGNKFHVHSMSQDSRKHIGVSEMVNENVIPAAQSFKEGCVEKGNSYSLYIRTDVAGRHGVLTAESGMLGKVASTDAVSLTEVVALSDDNQAGYPESSGQAKPLPQKEVLSFSNHSMKISVGSQGINESNSNIALRLDHKRKFFQLSKFSVAGKVHPRSSFEEEDKHIQQLTVGESLCSNDRVAQKVTKGSLQNRSGLLLTTSVSSSQGQEPCRSLPTSSDDQVPGNMVKYSNKNFVHFKSRRDDIVRRDGDSSTRISSATEKLKVSMQQTSSPGHFSQNIDEIQAQVSRASSATSSSPEATVVPSYRCRTDHCSPIQRSHIASRRIDYGSFNMAYLKGPVNVIQAERAKALQLPFKLAVKQGQHNVCENAEGYRHGSVSCGIDKEFGKVNVDRIQRQSHQIKSDVCMLGSEIEGAFVEAGQEVVLNSHDRNLSHSRTENQLQQNMMASHHGSWHPTLKYHPDVDPFLPQECCVDLTLERSKRFKWTTCSDKKMLESSCSEMVVESQGQNRQILDKCGETRGSKDPEMVKLNHRSKITEATQKPLSYKRLTAYQKDAGEQHGGSMHVPNQGQVMTSHLRKHPYPINHQGSSSFADTALNCTSMAQNTTGPTAHSSESRALQKTIAASGKGDSSKSHKKIDITSVLSHPWIQRWRPSYQITSSLCDMRCGSLSNKEINPRNLPHLYAPMKMMPSVAAMAIVGIAARQFPPCQLQKKGPLSVWTAVRFTVNGTAE